MRFRILWLVFLALPLTPTATDAAIVSVMGDLVEIAPPGSVQPGVLQDGINGRIFEERSSFVLPSTITVDIDGTLGSYDALSDLTGGTVGSGVTINSYLLHFDTVLGAPVYSGSVQFDNDIIGVIVLDGALDNSDLIGAPATSYPTPGLRRRGLDLTDFTVLDSVTLSNSTTLEFQVTSSNAIDHIRVLTTTAVPEPSTWSMLTLAGIGFGAFRRRKNQRTADEGAELRAGP